MSKKKQRIEIKPINQTSSKQSNLFVWVGVLFITTCLASLTVCGVALMIYKSSPILPTPIVLLTSTRLAITPTLLPQPSAIPTATTPTPTVVAQTPTPVLSQTKTSLVNKATDDALATIIYHDPMQGTFWAIHSTLEASDAMATWQASDLGKAIRNLDATTQAGHTLDATLEAAIFDLRTKYDTTEQFVDATIEASGDGTRQAIEATWQASNVYATMVADYAVVKTVDAIEQSSKATAVAIGNARQNNSAYATYEASDAQATFQVAFATWWQAKDAIPTATPIPTPKPLQTPN